MKSLMQILPDELMFVNTLSNGVKVDKNFYQIYKDGNLPQKILSAYCMYITKTMKVSHILKRN